ncbi:MAG: type II toxin-antitoxin system VapC family toxin [Methylocystis sp.]|nr:type II toxin-antitoxin system VapC family toxin [Methylocystis sp.]
MRRHPDQARQFLKAHENFRQAEIKFLDVDFAVVLALAQRRGLTAYDASYVWLAATRGLDLVSLDKRMLSAFEAEKAGDDASKH